MNKKYVITRRVAIWVIVFIISMFGVAINAVKMFQSSHPLPLSATSIGQLEKGDYVGVEIDKYAISLFSDPADGHYTGISQTYLIGPKSNYLYTIPYKNNKYVRIWITDRGTDGLLKEFYFGEGRPVPLIAVVGTNELEVNSTWYSWSDVTDDQIVTEFYLTEINTEIMRSCLLFFLLMLVIAGFFVVKYTKDDPKKIGGKKGLGEVYRSNYVFTDELQIQQNNMKKIKSQLQAVKYWGFAGLIFMASGAYVHVAYEQLSMKIVGVLFVVFGAIRVWICFFASHLRFPMWVNRVLNRRTLQTQKAEIQKRIEDLEKRING